MGGRDSYGVWDLHVHSLSLRWVTNKDLLLSSGNSAPSYVEAWMGEEYRGEWTHVYVWLSRCAVHLETITTVLIILLQYKIKCQKKKGEQNHFSARAEMRATITTYHTPNAWDGVFQSVSFPALPSSSLTSSQTLTSCPTD